MLTRRPEGWGNQDKESGDGSVIQHPPRYGKKSKGIKGQRDSRDLGKQAIGQHRRSGADKQKEKKQQISLIVRFAKN